MSAETVAVEPAHPVAESRHEILPGVQAERTTRLWVDFEPEKPPLFSPAIGPLTAPVREIGYRLVKTMIQIKGLPLIRNQSRGDHGAPNPARRYYRAVRSSLTAGLVLPGMQTPASDQSPEMPTGRLAFEASRQVIEYTSTPDHMRLICHVFAPRRERIVDRLLTEFFSEFDASSEESSVCDVESRLCFVGRSSFRVGRRHYWEILIGPLDGLAGSFLPGSNQIFITDQESPTKVDGQITMTPKRHLKAVRPEIGTAPSGALALAETDARSRADWIFISEQIDQAHADGAELDEDFVERLARRRFEYARTAMAAENPGPTLESSRRVVRQVVEIHRLTFEANGE